MPPASNPEKLRKTYKVLENAFLYALGKHGNVEWLADFSAGTFSELADYLLGRKVLHLEAVEDDNGHVPWGLVLKCEFQIRKKAMELIKDFGRTLKVALREAAVDQETRALYFTTHLTLQRRGGKGKGQGGGKADGGTPQNPQNKDQA